MSPREEKVLQYAKVALLFILTAVMTWFAYGHR